jgi:RNA polymerase sigma-70 factor (ECF subfamily)
MIGAGPAVSSRQWASLIDRARRLEPGAFDEIVDMYAARLFRFFQRMTGRPEEAEDLVQEVFVRVVKTIGEYREEGRFEAWLFRIAGNLARDRIRREAAAPDPGSAETDDVLRPRAERGRTDRAAPGNDRLERREESERLQTCILRLPLHEREVVLLRHYGRLSFAEIAEDLGAPIGTVLARAHRGLTRLRQWMEDER